jgi:hypothetical protein
MGTVSAWLYENGFMLDLLILLALVMQISSQASTKKIQANPTP